MARQNQQYYIAPSAISITPNANGLQTDLAVYVAKGTKIKVYNPYIEELDTQDANFAEWTLAGRNRRLADASVPYTIYARLSKSNHSDGYLTFAPMVLNDYHEWEDPYVLSPNTSSSQKLRTTDRHGYTHEWAPIPNNQTHDNRTDYWWIKLGTVSLPDAGQRTVSLDTGILGTDQFNAEWLLNPDGLPLRVELSCSVDGEIMGQIPYILWNKNAQLSARLVEGWSTDAGSLIRQWTISRNSGNQAADEAWNYPYGDSSTSAGSDSSSSGEPTPSDGRRMPGGHITLAHKRGISDDFASAPAVIFTITAWGEKTDPDSSDSSLSEGHTENSDSSSSGKVVLVPIATGVITMLAETVETFSIEPSVSTVSFNPLTGEYTPAGGVVVRIRAKAQDGTVTRLTQQQIQTAMLHVYYLPAGQDAPDSSDSDSSSDAAPELVFVGGQAVLPTSAFADGESINLWLANGAGVELDRTTVAFVRYGERGMDGDGSEYVFIRTKTDTAPVVLYKPNGYKDSKGHTFLDDDFLPVVDSTERTDIEKDNSGDETNFPYECSDDPKGVSTEYKYEWSTKRTMGAADSHGRRKWTKYSGVMSLFNYLSENAVRLDIDNEMDAVPTDSMGVVKETTVVETVVHLYDGAQEVTINKALLTAAGINYNGGTAGAVIPEEGQPATGVLVRWTLQAGWQISAINKARISYTYKSVPYVKEFTVAASLGQPIMQLKPSHSSLPCTRNLDNTLADPPVLSLKVVKVDGSSSDEKNATASNLTALGVTVRYSLSAMPATVSDGYDWASLNPANSLQVANTDLSVYIAMFNASGVLLDRETIPVIKDGKHGKNSVRCALDNEHEDFLYNDDGVLIAPAGGVTSQARLYDGSDEKVTVVTWSIDEWETSGVLLDTSDPDFATKGTSISSAGLLTVKHITANTAKVKVRAEYPANGGIFYYAEFTANKNSQDKYDLVVAPNAIACNPKTYPTEGVTIEVSAKRTDLQGNQTTPDINVPGTSASDLYVYWASVGSDGTIGTLQDLADVSKTVTAQEAADYAGIYFELRLYTDSEHYRLCDYETVEIAKSENAPYDISAYGCSNSRTNHDASNMYHAVAGDSGWYDTAPATSATYPYLWERIQHYNSAGQAEGSPSYVCLTGGTGPQGPAAVNVIVSPASLIVNQDLENPDNLSNLTETFVVQVKVGEVSQTINGMSFEAEGVSLNAPKALFLTNGGSSAGSGSINGNILTLKRIMTYTEGSGESQKTYYYDRAYVDITVNYGASKTITTRASVYANLLGTWKQTIEGDVSTVVAQKTTYYVNGQACHVESDLGTYVQSSTENMSRLERETSGTNILPVLKRARWVNDVEDVPLGGDANEYSFVGADIYTPVVYLPNSKLVLSAYTEENEDFEPDELVKNLRMWAFSEEEPDPTQGIEYQTPPWQDYATISGDTIVINNMTYYRRKIVLESPPEGFYSFEFEGFSAIVRPQLELGANPSRFDTGDDYSRSMIRQTADEIELKVGDCGIDIDNKKIYLRGDTVVDGNFQAKQVISENDKMQTSISAGTLLIESKQSKSKGIFCVDAQGEIVLQLYDKNGNLKINLGGRPDTAVYGNWARLRLMEVPGSSPSRSSCIASDADCENYYLLALGKIENGTAYKYFDPAGNEITPSVATGIDNHVYEIQDYISGDMISDGYYVQRNDGIFPQMIDPNTSTAKEYCTVYHYVNGLEYETINVLFE